MIVVLYYILFSFLLIYGLYFIFTGVIGLIRKSSYVASKSNKKNKFAILIAARNEEKVIGNLIDSLNKQDYPLDKYEIFVIPNNCNDKTKEVATSKGAQIITCKKKTKTKGDVLRVAFAKLKKEDDIDAYIIFDADNIVHPEFLKHMNEAFNSGYHVAQGFRDAKNPSDNWLSGSYSLFYLLQNVFLNRGRMGLNSSAFINGTGFMISKSLIDEKGFNTVTLTEDMEFSGLCALNNERIAYVDDAITYDEYPKKFNSSWSQRKRWSAGIYRCMHLYNLKLIINFVKTGNFAALDMFMIYLGPLMQVLGFISLVWLIIFRIVGVNLHDIFSTFFALDWLCFAIGYIVNVLLCLFVLYYKHKKVSNIISGLILFPVFIITWIPINIVCLFKKQTKWEEITHNRDIKITDVMEP